MKKGIGIIFLFLVLSFNIVSAVTVVEVPQEQAQPSGFSLGSMFSFLKSPIFWGIVFLLFIGALFLVGLFFLIRWLIKFIKTQNDIFYKMRKDRIKLASIHSTYDDKHWWKIEKNTPIRLVHIINGKPMISKPIGYHRGDYTTHEGNVIITMHLVGKKKWYILPEIDILVIPNKETQEFRQKDEKGDSIKVSIVKMPRASDIVHFEKNDIFIYAESISKVGIFHIPVLKDDTGKIIDLSLPTYITLKEVIMGDYLYEQTDEFGKLAKQSMNINPHIRAVQKIGDTNQNVDVGGTPQ